MKRYEFNKLIRNKLPERMINEGVVINSIKLDATQYILKLKEKLLEETNELIVAENLNDIKIEMADVLEVIHSMAMAWNIKYEDIEQIRLEKKLINGTFDSDTYVNYIEVDQTNTKVINYLDDKYRPYKLET